MTFVSSTLGLEFQNPVQKLCVLFYPMLVKYNSIHQSVNENISDLIKATCIYIIFSGSEAVPVQKTKMLDNNCLKKMRHFTQLKK